MARGAWALNQVAASTGKVTPTVWLPDYFCYGATSPLRQSGAVLMFYPVDQDMRPDWNRCRTIAETTPVDVFVLVHTFGRENVGNASRSFADGHGAILVEDAAHVFVPTGNIGTFGDAVFFSPHKWLPIPDGAVLWTRDGLSIPPTPIAPHPTGRWTLKRLIQGLLPSRLQPSPLSQGPQRFFDDPVPTDTVPNPGLSKIAQSMLAEWTPETIQTTAHKRHKNHMAWAEGLASRSEFSVLESPETAYRCVVKASSPARAEILFNACRNAGVPAESWPDMPPPVLANPSNHTHAINLRRQLVMLPVHQDITPGQISRACEMLSIPT